MPIRLWSTVVIQARTRPSRHVGATTSVLTAIGLTLRPQILARLDVLDQRVDLEIRPTASDWRHVACHVGLVLPLLDELGEALPIHERPPARDGRPVTPPPRRAVALGADAFPGRPAERRLRVTRLLAFLLGPPPLVRRGGKDLDLGGHDRVESAAELGALPFERPLVDGREPQRVRSAGEGVALSRQLRDPPAVVHVEGGDPELDRLVDGEDEPVD